MSSDSNESTSRNKDTGGKSRVSLYSLMGEESGINLFVEQLYHAMLAEPVLRPLFNIEGLDALKAEQKEFVAIILGGRPPLDYWDIITSDPPPYLTLEHTDLMIEYAEAVLLNMGIDDAAVKNIIRVLSPFIEAFICGSTRADAKPCPALPPSSASSAPAPAEVEIEPVEEITELKEDQPEIELKEAVTWEQSAEVELHPVEETEGEDRKEEVDEQMAAESHSAEPEPAQLSEETENARKFRELIEEKLYQKKTQKPVLPENEGEFVPSEIPPAADSRPAEPHSEDTLVSSESSSPARLTAERLVSSLNLLLSELEGASTGDLTAEISLTGDDLVGRLGASVQELISDVRRSISRLLELVEDINRTSDDLSQIIRDREESRQRMTNLDNDDSIVSAREEVGKASSLSARILHSLRTFLLESQRTIEENTGSEKEASEPLHALISHNDEFQYLIRSLREMTSRGATLALNAALEAARAGNEGKCFAVIASEMKDLSRGAEQLALNMSRNFKACRYYAHETLSALDKGEQPRALSLPSGLEADLNSLGESLTRIDAKVSGAMRQKTMLEAAEARRLEGDGHYTEKMFELGKKVRELKLVLSKYVV